MKTRSLIEITPDCWIWTGNLNGSGYVRITIAGVRQYLHRFAWEHTYGPIPDGLVIDHICHDPKMCNGGADCQHRSCGNPQHLKAVPNIENISATRAVSRTRETTHCPKGHPYDEKNTRRYQSVNNGKSRLCWQCKLDYQRRYRARQR